MSNPRLFISYSWSSPDHEKWVLTLAEDLVSQGIDVVLDKWNLKPGHDAHAFMESMVTDPDVTKVLLVCDRQYAAKSDKRLGGTGTEAQIITPELYTKKEQDKFVAIVRERDDAGNAYLPVYYKGRIYIDLSDAANYASEFEKLVRWAWDKPVHIKPDLGKRPSFLEESGHTRIATTITFKRAIEAIKSIQGNAVPFVMEYFDILAAEMEKFRIAPTGPEFDELFIKSIDDFLPFRNEFLEVIGSIAIYRCDADMLQAIHRFFENVIPYLEAPQNVTSWTDTDFDNYCFIVHEMFLYCQAIFLKHEQFDSAAFFIENEYFFDNRFTQVSMHPYIIFRRYLKSLGHRNQRLNLGRLSLRADLLKERNQASGIDFKHLMAADLILYLRSMDRGIRIWWPETLIWASLRGATFEMFARAKSARYFDRIKRLLGVNDKLSLNDLLMKIESHPDNIPKWQFDSFSPRALVQFDSLSSSP